MRFTSPRSLAGDMRGFRGRSGGGVYSSFSGDVRRSSAIEDYRSDDADSGLVLDNTDRIYFAGYGLPGVNSYVPDSVGLSVPDEILTSVERLVPEPERGGIIDRPDAEAERAVEDHDPGGLSEVEGAIEAIVGSSFSAEGGSDIILEDELGDIPDRTAAGSSANPGEVLPEEVLEHEQHGLYGEVAGLDQQPGYEFDSADFGDAAGVDLGSDLSVAAGPDSFHGLEGVVDGFALDTGLDARLWEDGGFDELSADTDLDFGDAVFGADAGVEYEEEEEVAAEEDFLADSLDFLEM